MMDKNEQIEGIEALEQAIADETPQGDQNTDGQQEGQQDEGENEAEAEARKYGWRPREEYDLDPEGWVDADRFLELPSTQRKVLRDTNRDLTQRLDESKKEFDARVARLEAANKAAMDRALAAQRDQYETRMEALRQKQREAAETGDMDAYDRWGKAQEDLQAKAPDAQRPETPKDGPSPELVAYVESDDGKWLKDPYMLKRANEIIEEIPPGQRPAGARAQAEYAADKLRTYYPHVFGEAKAKAEPPPKHNRVDGGGLAPTKGKKGASSLPPEAKAAAKEFIEAGVYKSVEEYAEDYWKEVGK